MHFYLKSPSNDDWIQLKVDRLDKPLWHVAMVAKFLDLNTTACVPANMVGKNEKKKAVTKQDAGTTHQQNDQTSHCGAHVLTESTREWDISALIMQ